jgi:hypothetical protein
MLDIDAEWLVWLIYISVNVYYTAWKRSNKVRANRLLIHVISFVLFNTGCPIEIKYIYL